MGEYEVRRSVRTQGVSFFSVNDYNLSLKKLEMFTGMQRQTGLSELTSSKTAATPSQIAGKRGKFASFLAAGSSIHASSSMTPAGQKETMTSFSSSSQPAGTSMSCSQTEGTYPLFV